MTSSLVGSEMCIRDSFRAPPTPIVHPLPLDYPLALALPEPVVHLAALACLLYTSDAADDM
eukprot:10160514-Prorocentrum_lima.AAC.1